MGRRSRASMRRIVLGLAILALFTHSVRADDLSGRAVVLVVTRHSGDATAMQIEAELKSMRGTLGLSKSEFPLVFMDFANPATRRYLKRLGIDQGDLPAACVVRWGRPAPRGPEKIIGQLARRLDPDHLELPVDAVGRTWIRASGRQSLSDLLPSRELLSDDHPPVALEIRHLTFSATGAPGYELKAHVSVDDVDKRPAQAVRVSLHYLPHNSHVWLLLARQVYKKIPAGFSIVSSFVMDTREVTDLLDSSGHPRSCRIKAMARQGGREYSISGTFTPPDRWVVDRPVAPPKAAEKITDPVDGTVLVLIPGATFTMGATDVGEVAMNPHLIRVNSFFMATREVTNAKFARFVAATGYDAGTQWKSQAQQWGPQAPVVYVSWTAAKAYCKWAGLRLPTEAEWELAAGGPNSRMYPWGNKWSDRALVYNALKPEPVGSCSSGATPRGLLDMAGNVWEWTANFLTRYPGNTDPRKIYNQRNVVVRGGSYANTDHNSFRCARRYYRDRLGTYSDVGFRCARSLKPSQAAAAVWGAKSP